jgi:transcription factor SPT20
MQNTSSPLASNIMMNGGQSVSMSVSTSNQGAGSPPRPGSAVQHGHPINAAAMVAQRSQQPPSRNGTPQMANGTPRVQQATPVMQNVTPMSRMSQTSPISGAMAATPTLAQSMAGAPHLSGQQPTAQQQQVYLQQQRQQALSQQQQHMQGQMPNSQMSPHNLQQLAAHQAQQQANAAYRRQIHMAQQQQMANAHVVQRPTANGVPLQQPGQVSLNPQQQLARQQAFYTQVVKQAYTTLLGRAVAQYGDAGNIPPQVDRQMKERATQMGRQAVEERRQQFMMAQQQQQQQQQAMMGQMQGAAGMMGGMNGMGGI